MTGHDKATCSIAWASKILSTGSHDTTILHRDLRCPHNFIARSLGHKLEVCGLKWNNEET